MKTGKQETKVTEESDVVDAKSTAVVEMSATEVSTEVKVSGLQIRFATLQPFYSVCQLPETVMRECREGDLVLKLGKDSAFKLAQAGREGAVRAIVLDGKQGVLEGCPIASGSVPRVWSVGRRAEDGTVLNSLADCWRAASAAAPEVPKYRFEDYSKATNPIPSHYFAECCYLQLLVQVGDAVSDDVQLVKVGDALYTPAVVLFKKFDVISLRKFFNNIQVREAMSHRNDKDWKWSPTGQFVTVFTKGAAFKRPNGTTGTIWSPSIERALGDNGMLYSPTDEEREDLTRFLMMASDSTATVGDAAGDDEF